MKSIPQTRAILRAALLLTTLGARAVADAELDASFNPTLPAGYSTNDLVLLHVTRDGIILYGDTPGQVSRLHLDGTPDPAWRLYEGDSSHVTHLVPRADGGWLVDGASNFRIVRPDGGTIPLPNLAETTASQMAEPLALPDGSVLVQRGARFVRVRPDGTFGFQRNLGLLPLSERPGWSDARLGAVATFVTLDPRLYKPNAFLGSGVEGEPLDQFPEIPTPGAVGDLFYLSDGVDAQGNASSAVARNDYFGRQLWSVPVHPGSVTQFAVQPDSSVICAGSFADWQGTPVTGLVRLLPDGTRDPDFRVELAKTDGKVLVRRIELDDDGGLFLSGNFDAVNGVLRPGIAKLHAYSTVDSVPSVDVQGAPPRIAVNETLVLHGIVAGKPRPSLQWYRNDEAIPGATNPILRWFISDGAAVGRFTLATENTQGGASIALPSIEVARLTPIVSAPAEVSEGPVAGMTLVTQILPLPGGRMLLAGGGGTGISSVPLVAALRRDLTLDTAYGDGGVVRGVGIVESLERLDDGGVRLAGAFDEIAGLKGVGVVELDRDGRLRARAFPALDVPHATATLGLPGGGLMVSGLFNQIGGTPAYRLARLTPALALDATFHSPVPEFTVVDAMTAGLLGRVTIAGSRVQRDTPGNLPEGLGVLRLTGDGSLDSTFTPYRGAAGTMVHGQFDTLNLVVGPPAVVLGPGGYIEARIDLPPGVNPSPSTAPNPNLHALVATFDGGAINVVTEPVPSGTNVWRLRRWLSDGSLDRHFEPEFQPSAIPGSQAWALAYEDDASLVFACVRDVPGSNPMAVRVDVVRFPPDAEAHPRVRVADGKLRVTIPTRTGARYDAEARGTVDGPKLPFFQPQIQGDGYEQEVAVPVTGDTGFMLIHRTP